jgi:hypothetical protein
MVPFRAPSGKTVPRSARPARNPTRRGPAPPSVRSLTMRPRQRPDGSGSAGDRVADARLRPEAGRFLPGSLDLAETPAASAEVAAFFGP